MLTNFKLNRVNFADRYKERGYNNPRVLELLSKTSGVHTISFELNNVDASVANAIRRCVRDETPKRVMTFNVSDVETNSPFILTHLEDIINRFKLIPITQSIPMDAVMTYSAENNTDEEYVSIYTDQLKGNNNYCDTTYKIGNLNSYQYFRIKKITVIEGRGIEHACFQAPIGFTYTPIDYTCIDYAMENVVVAVIVKNTFGEKKRRLVNPGGKYPVPDGYDEVITDEIPYYNTNMVEPRDYKISFTFDNHFNGKEYFIKSLLVLIEKLKAAANTTFISVEGDTTTINLPLETATLGMLISRGIYELNPEIAYVCAHNRHLTEPNMEIRITDPNVKSLYATTIKKRIELIEGLIANIK